jgi:hypothetical protein
MALAVLLLGGATKAQGRLSFPAPDGYRLHADQYGKGEKGVVLVHGGRLTAP